MAAPDIGSIVTLLPDILFLSDIASYVLGTLFFGSIAVRGLRGDFSFPLRLGIRIASGLACMLGGLAIRPFFSFASVGIYQLLHIDLFLASITFSVIFSIGFYLVTFRLYNIPKMEKKIKHMQEELKKAKQSPKETHGWSDPIKLSGISIIIALIILVAFTFHGFPRPSEDILQMIGIDSTQLSGNPNCPGPLAVLTGVGEAVNTAEERTGAIGASMERQTKSTLRSLRVVSYQGKEVYVGFLDSGYLCTATSVTVCGCIESGGAVQISGS